MRGVTGRLHHYYWAQTHLFSAAFLSMEPFVISLLWFKEPCTDQEDAEYYIICKSKVCILGIYTQKHLSVGVHGDVTPAPAEGFLQEP